MTRKVWSVLLGLILLAWGLSMLGVPGFAQAGDLVAWVLRLWPLILVVWGAHHTYQGLLGKKHRRGQGLVFGLAVLGLGLALLVDNLGLDVGVPLSPLAALLVGAGLGFLLRAIVSP